MRLIAFKLDAHSDSLFRHLVEQQYRAKRNAGLHDLRVATIFTFAANEDDKDANGLIAVLQDPNIPEKAVRAKALAEQGMAGMDQLCATLLALLPKVQHG